MRKSHVGLAALLLGLVGLAVPAVRHLREQPPPPPSPIRLTLGAPPGTELGSGDEVLDAAISPDERTIVFVATSEGTTALWRRAIDSDRAEAIRGTEGAQLPAWNRAGDAVSFFAAGRLRTISLESSEVSDLAEASSPAGAAWLADNSVLFARPSLGIARRLSDGAVSDATRLQPGDRAHVFPSQSGTSVDFVYTAVGVDGRRTVRLVRSGEERDLTTTAGHGQLVGDHLLSVRDGVLLAQRLDQQTGRLQGRAVPVSPGVGATAGGRSLFIASPRVLLSAASSPRARELAWFDFEGRRTGAVGESGEFWQTRLSPDDQYAAVTLMAPLLRTLDVVVMPTGRGTQARPLTLALASDSDPVWAPDGRRILFRSLQKGRPALFTKRAHTRDAGDESLLEVDAAPSDWRGSTALIHELDPASGHDIWAIDVVTMSRSPVVKSGFNDTDARLSPDGRWVAYVSDEPGRPDVYAQIRSSGGRVRVSSAGGTRPRWSRDGRSLFFLRGSTLMRAAFRDGSPAGFDLPVKVVDLPGVRDFDVAHRRDALLALVPIDASSSAPVSALIDWQSSLPTTP